MNSAHFRDTKDNAENKYHVFDKMIEGIQVIDDHWKYIYVNETVTKHGKYSREALLGCTMMEKYPGIDQTSMFTLLQQCMANSCAGEMINEFDFPDGSKGYFDIRMRPVPEGILIMSIDVTDQKRAEHILRDTNAHLDELVNVRTSELILKNKELEQFAYIASHDLQEPLRTISNYMDIFKEDFGNVLNEEAIGYIHSVKSATVRMEELTRSLLDYSRLGIEKNLSRIDVKELLGNILSDLQHIILSCGAVITFEEMPVICAYETELRQLFQNLIMNALKFRKKNTQPIISIYVKAAKEHCQFFVQDNGIGIEKGNFDKIFKIFQRLHLREEYEGTGIGLANCKKIAEMHRGKINVESTPGIGSTFSFTIPDLC